MNRLLYDYLVNVRGLLVNIRPRTLAVMLVTRGQAFTSCSGQKSEHRSINQFSPAVEPVGEDQFIPR